MNFKKQIFIILVTTIFIVTPLLKGMEFDFQKFYNAERNTLDLNNRSITAKFLNENQQKLRDFIFKNSVQKLDLQRNGLKQIPVCTLKILLEEQSPLKEINIVFPKLGVGSRSLFQIKEIQSIQGDIDDLKLNIQTTINIEESKILLTLSKKQ